MTAPFRYDRFGPADDGSHDALMRQAFASPADRNAHYRATIGTENLRFLRAGGEAIATLALVAMGQWYGGRSVPCAGIGALAVAPPWRGRGVSGALLTEALTEARARGLALATLYPSTVPVYRKVGFEAAGREIVYIAESDRLVAGKPPAPGLRRTGPEDLPLLHTLKAEEARIGAGLVDRPPAFWKDKLEPFGRTVDGYLVEGAERPEGYLMLAHDDQRRLEVIDWCAATGSAARQILAALAGHRSIFAEVAWRGGPADLLTCHLPDRGWTIGKQREWLTRIVDVERALAARGYPDGLTAAITLAVRDPLLPWNDDRFVLRVAGGRGTVGRGGAGGGPALTLDVGALAPLYTGHFGPALLARAGRIDGPPAALAAAALIFAGPSPWMVDHF